MTFLFLSLLFLFYHIYAYIEMTPIAYFPTFAIKFLHWPVKDASLLMSVFFGTNCAGRFLGILLSFVLRPRTMIIINLIVTTIAYVILLSVQSLSKLLWASAALSGIGMATTFATTVLWTAESMVFSGRVASIVVAGFSFGNVVQPQIVGRLFEIPAVGGPMSMVYFLITAALVHIILFVCMLVFAARCLTGRQLLRETVVGVPMTSQTLVETWCHVCYEPFTCITAQCVGCKHNTIAMISVHLSHCQVFSWRR